MSEVVQYGEGAKLMAVSHVFGGGEGQMSSSNLHLDSSKHWGNIRGPKYK